MINYIIRQNKLLYWKKETTATIPIGKIELENTLMDTCAEIINSRTYSFESVFTELAAMWNITKTARL